MFHFSLKAFPESSNKFPIKLCYDELQKFFTFIVGDSELESLPFVDLRFIAFLLTSYFSFMKKFHILKIEDVYIENEGFVLSFKKGKLYKFGGEPY
jgi:hypothetical protein